MERSYGATRFPIKSSKLMQKSLDKIFFYSVLLNLKFNYAWRHMRHGNPDKGPTSPSDYDLGYKNDLSNESPYYPGGMRGNEYTKLQNEIKHRDEKKLKREKFTKIA